ncbi:MAG: hypothetical protein ABI726_02085 [bacterium]
MAERVSLTVSAATLEWEPAELLRGADRADPAEPAAWALAGGCDWTSIESLRVISACFGDTAVAIAIARPAGAAGADADRVAGVRLAPGGPESVDDALVSTEYDSNGVVRRIGVELWPQSGTARRLAADRAGEPQTTAADGIRREATPMAFRLDGERGTGLHELVRPA